MLPQKMSIDSVSTHMSVHSFNHTHTHSDSDCSECLVWTRNIRRVWIHL